MVAKWNASVTNRYQLLPRCDDRGDESSAASELLARSETSARRVSRLAVERRSATHVAATSRAQRASCSPGAKRPRGGDPASQLSDEGPRTVRRGGERGGGVGRQERNVREAGIPPRS